MLQQLFKFKGGVKPDTNKTPSVQAPIGIAPIPKLLVVPLHQSIGGIPNPLVAAGGTGGPIFPGLAVARTLQSRGAPVSWLGSPQGLEGTLVPPTRIPLDQVVVSGVRGGAMQARARVRGLHFAPVGNSPGMRGVDGDPERNKHQYWVRSPDR